MQTVALLSQNAFVARPAAVKPRAARNTVVRAANDTWYYGATRPSWLDGSLPGDRGFDPLGLAARGGDTLKYLANGEVINGRWAMTAVVGILAADATGHDFYTAGAQEYAIDLKTQLAVGIPTFAVLEGLRAKGWEETKDFKFQDPAGMDSQESRTKEVKNGRLAMLAFIGIFSQHAVQGLGPIECLQKHLEDPAANNIFTSAVGPEATIGAIALAVTPMLIEARNALDGDKDDFKPIPW